MTQELYEGLAAAVDDLVPTGVTHVGFVPTNAEGNLLITELPNAPHGVNASFCKLKVNPGESASRTLWRCFEQQVGEMPDGCYPIPTTWATPNGASYYFAGMLWHQGSPTNDELPSKSIRGLKWLSPAAAREAIQASKNEPSKRRDLALIDAATSMCLSPHRRVLLMLTELHKMGLERLRAPCYEYPLAWRCPIVPAAWTLQHHGGLFKYPSGDFGTTLRVAEGLTTYSSASRQQPFGWTDMAFSSPREFAQRFIREHPAIAVAGWGPDPDYTAWFQRALKDTAPNGIYSSFSEYWGPDNHLNTFCSTTGTLPLPPPGGLDEREFNAIQSRLSNW